MGTPRKVEFTVENQHTHLRVCFQTPQYHQVIHVYPDTKVIEWCGAFGRPLISTICRTNEQVAKEIGNFIREIEKDDRFNKERWKMDYRKV